MEVVCLVVMMVGSVESVRAAEVVLRDTPCRLYDSRNVGGLGSGSKISSSTGATIETFDTDLDVVSFTSNGIDYNMQGGETGCRVPASATGVVINLTAFQPDSSGWARLWSYGSTEPLSTSINVTSGQLNEATGLMVKSGTDGKISLSTIITTSHYVIDLAGYTESCDTIDSFEIRYNETNSKIFVPSNAADDLSRFGPAGRKIRLGGDASQPGLYTITWVSLDGKQIGVTPAPQTATDQALEVHLLSGDCSPRSMPLDGVN